ncbi:transmembrane emp24 domain-containing protein 5 [Anoplophora glabripennis]|uniref:transmembrane emp24 domain-containing protein 5 n=1 Tax=Anoplophora glabripennis TaxID=217634 RepID=UPI0008749499|nr:transmembrane emp24 domain-containing protein 5 [Anoplophora glabripennis]
MKQCTFVSTLFLIHYVQSLEREITINVDPGKEDCFFQKTKEGDVIDLDYQVIDGGHGDLDITFHLVDPTGRILVADYKKSENTHRADASVTGDYKFCFDNTFSTYNSKTVFFELIVEGNDDNEWGSEENLDFEGINLDQIYELKVQDVQEIVNSVRNHLTKVRHLQDLIKSTEARDRNIAEENYFKVNTYSFLQLLLMMAVGLIQVVMVKSLFDEQSKAHKIWKNLNLR